MHDHLMNKIKQWIILLVLTTVFLNQCYCDDLNIPQGKERYGLVLLMANNRSIDKENYKSFGFNKEPIDWTESDFELLQAALENEVKTNNNFNSPTDKVFLKIVDEGVNKMKKEQGENQKRLAKEHQQKELYDKIGQLRASIASFLKIADQGVYRAEDVLSSNDLAQIKAVEIEYQKIRVYAKEHDIDLYDNLESDLAKIREHQDAVMPLYEMSELQKRESKNDRHIALVVAIASFVISIVLYFALHRRKINRLKSRIQLLAVLEDGSTLDEEKQAIDSETELQAEKWKTLRPQIAKHLIEKYKPIIDGDSRSIILESVTLRLKEGLQDLQSFLPPSVRLPASHYAESLLTDEDVEKFKMEQNNIASLLEEEFEPDYENETVVWVGES